MMKVNLFPLPHHHTREWMGLNPSSFNILIYALNIGGKGECLNTWSPFYVFLIFQFAEAGPLFCTAVAGAACIIFGMVSKYCMILVIIIPICNSSRIHSFTKNAIILTLQQLLDWNC